MSEIEPDRRTLQKAESTPLQKRGNLSEDSDVEELNLLSRA